MGRIINSLFERFSFEDTFVINDKYKEFFSNHTQEEIAAGLERRISTLGMKSGFKRWMTPNKQVDVTEDSISLLDRISLSLYPADENSLTSKSWDILFHVDPIWLSYLIEDRNNKDEWQLAIQSLKDFVYLIFEEFSVFAKKDYSAPKFKVGTGLMEYFYILNNIRKIDPKACLVFDSFTYIYIPTLNNIYTLYSSEDNVYPMAQTLADRRALNVYGMVKEHKDKKSLRAFEEWYDSEALATIFSGSEKLSNEEAILINMDWSGEYEDKTRCILTRCLHYFKGKKQELEIYSCEDGYFIRDSSLYKVYFYNDLKGIKGFLENHISIY